MKKNFSIIEYILNEQDPPNIDQDQGNVNSAPVAQNSEKQTPDQQTQDLKATSDPFVDFKGSIIKDIKFVRTSLEGGSIEVFTNKSLRPITISWENNRVTLQKPNGDIVTLS